MSKLSLQTESKRRLFLSASSPRLSKVCKFSMETAVVPFLSICFRSASAPSVFTKLIKKLQLRLNIPLFLYVDDILLIARFQKEFISTGNTLIFLLQNLGFLINLEKAVLQVCHRQNFRRYVVVDSRNMALIQ